MELSSKNNPYLNAIKNEQLIMQKLLYKVNLINFFFKMYDFV